MSNVNHEKAAMADKVNALEIVICDLPEKDRSFAGSLVSQYNLKGHLSDRQMYWVGIMFDRATNREMANIAPKAVGNFGGVYALFEKAKQHLKYPKIHLQCNGFPLQLSLAGANAKFPNVLNVTDGGGYGHNRWYGRVEKDGGWSGGGQVAKEELEAVEKLLKMMAENPAKVAKEQALLTGRCCFCNLKLKDEKSTAAGFGPVCADHFGLKAQWKKAVGVIEEFAAA